MSQELFIGDIRKLARKVMPENSQIILFGSQARGDAHDGSDWDLLLLLQDKKSWSDAFDKYAFPFVELGWQNNTEVNPLIYTFDEWSQRQNTPFYYNVENEGIRI